MFPNRADLAGLASYARDNPVTSVDDVQALWGETVQAGLRQVLNEERTDSANRAYRPFFEQRAEAIIRLGGDPGLARMYEAAGTGMANVRDNMRAAGEEMARLMFNDQMVDAVLQADDFAARFPGEVQSDAAIDQLVADDLAKRRAINQSTLARGSGAAGFIGAAAGAATDPLVLATLPLGPGTISGRGIAGNAARAFLAEGGVALATEIPIQAQVMRFKAEIDSPWSFADAAYNVLAATLGAGAIRASGSVTIDVWQEVLAGYRGLPAARQTPEGDAAAEILIRALEYDRENPFIRAGIPEPVDPAVFTEAAQRAVHQRATTRARGQLEAGEAVDVADIVRDVEPLDPVQAVTRATLDDVTVLEPGELIVDAQRFQFKSGGDAEGVTASLADVTEFDQRLAGQILAWQDEAGRLFVVDGHQRVGLANRALAGGQDPAEVRLPAFVVRAADGVSDLDAMRIGAIRNLSASTGSALDAAKVLRGIGPAGEAMLPPLPPNSAVLRQGRYLARLGDDAFNAVVNEVTPQRYGAIVGELLRDGPEQLAAIDALARLNPANEVQARAMVEQMRTAGFQRQTTEDLFGERDIALSLVRERAQVVDAALKSARADRATFGRLVSRGTDIEGVGANRLDSGANQQKVQQSGQAIEIISRLANTAGPVSEAITQAAEQVAAGARAADVIDPVLTAVGRSPAVSDTGGRQAIAARDAPAGRLDPEGNPVNPVTATEPRAKALQLHELGGENDEIVRPVLEAIDAEFGTASKTSFKKIDTILAKVQRPTVLAKRPWFDVEHIRDSYRFKTVIEPEADIAAVGNALARFFDAVPEASMVKADVSMLFEPKMWGWRAAVFDIQMPNGQLVEWYMPIRELENAKKAGGHQLFEKWRDEDVTALGDRQAEFLTDLAEAQQLYADAWAAALKRMGQDESAARAALESSLASSPIAGVNVSARSDDVIGVLPELDQTSFSRTPTKPSEPSTTTVEPSSATATKSAAIDAPPDEIIPSTAGQNDLFGAPQPARAGAPDEGGATGFVSDADYDEMLAAYADLEGDVAVLEVSRVGLDERGELTTETVSARQAFEDLNAQERALNDIEACTR